MTNDENITIYAQECEIFIGGACNWNSGFFASYSEDGKPMTASKCSYDVNGINAGKHPCDCAMRKTILASRARRETSGLVTASIG